MKDIFNLKKTAIINKIILIKLIRHKNFYSTYQIRNLNVHKKMYDIICTLFCSAIYTLDIWVQTWGMLEWRNYLLYQKVCKI